MSITFFCPEAPTTTEKERCAQCEGLSTEAGHDVFGCADSLCRSGWIEYPTSALPEVNFSVANAAAVLRLLGEEPASDGEWSATDLDRVIRTALAALNDHAKIATEAVPASTSCGAARFVADGNVVQIVRGASCIDFGSDAEGIVRRLHEVVTLCIEARKSGWRVIWC
jgi:hypothetical protein